MREPMEHPNAQHLEAYVEGSLSDRERTHVRMHLLTCRRCETDVEEWRGLFSALQGLPRFAPAPGFAERIMSVVRIPRPWHARAWNVLEQLLPRSTWGWAATAAVFALPIVAGVTLMVWLLSKSYVTAHGLWVFSTGQFAAAALSIVGGGANLVMQTDVAAWFARSLETATQTGPRGIGALAITGTILTLISIWVIYRYLFRSRTRDTTYATFSF